MARYKAKVVSVKAEQCEKQMGNIPAGTWYLKVLFHCNEKLNTEYDEWEAVNTDKDLLFDQKYFLGHDIMTTSKTGETRSMYECSRYFMQEELGFAGNDSELEKALIDMKRILVTEVNAGGYENIKYINDPDKKRKPMVSENKAQEFASIFNRK